MVDHEPYVTIRSRRPADGSSMSSGDSAVRGHNQGLRHQARITSLTSDQYGSSPGDDKTPSATHDVSRVSFHVKNVGDFAKQLEDSAARAFPNHGRSQRYKKVQALLLHWKSDDLFVLPELEDLEQCLREDYSFDTETYAIPSENSHLELMLRIGQMIKEHESTDTLFMIYYGGHARIDESRQSTWCATRGTGSPWLQWSAIQTLLERSLSDVLILLDCCAGAASATFPTGSSITETISASSWDAIAPDPGRYSFTNAVIEVLQEWKNRVYSAAMLHAEVLARLKHPRPVMLNGKHFEARSTPVHFMMTSNHRAPSIEICRTVTNDKRPPSPPQEPEVEPPSTTGRSGGPPAAVASDPTEDVPHVMISLALEDDQRLDLNAWENWLAAFPAIAKYVKVQGVFQSHSTLLLLSLPVMVWDLLPENLACNFVAFIRSNNLAIKGQREPESAEVEVAAGPEEESRSIYSGTTMLSDYRPLSMAGSLGSTNYESLRSGRPSRLSAQSYGPLHISPSSPNLTGTSSRPQRRESLSKHGTAAPSLISRATTSDAISRQVIFNQARSSKRTLIVDNTRLPQRPDLAPHVKTRLEEYFLENPTPSVAVKEFLASNLGIETADIDLWLYHRHEQQEVARRLQDLKIDDFRQQLPRDVAHMILPGHLNELLEILPPDDVLLLDLRSPTEYERSHIYGAVNLRLPASFIQAATLDLIEKAITDEGGQTTFSSWHMRRCVVFYDRCIEYAWECPTAQALLQKFKNKLWEGQGFVLKGHYREFSTSYDKYIIGQRMSDEAKCYLESRQLESLDKAISAPQDVSNLDSTNLGQQRQIQYDSWLKVLEEEDRVLSADVSPPVRAEREEAILQHQKDLEHELEQRLPSLYRKVVDIASDEKDWDRKAGLVEPLTRGIAKMQEAGADQLAGDDYPEKLHKRQQSGEEYEIIDVKDEQSSQQRSQGSAQAAEDPMTGGTSSGGSDVQKRGRGRGLLKRLRSGR